MPPTVGAYTYNAYNQCTKKVAGTTTHYVYGAGGLLYGEYDNSGDLIREYVYLNGQPLAQINAGSPETLTYLHPDHLGTPKFGTNAGGTQVWAWTPDAFGNGAPSGSVTVNLRMPGQYFDAESSLHYNWNRYYNPAIGRYISSDPIGLEGGINTFLYAVASPVMNIDPDGQLVFAPVLAWFGGAAASLPSAAAIGVAIADGFAKATAGIILMSSLTGDTPQARETCPPATATMDPNNDPECQQLNENVQVAKKVAASLGKCTAGMASEQLQIRYNTWVALGNARARRDEKCWGGGDPGEQQQQADVWTVVGNCSRLMR